MKPKLRVHDLNMLVTLSPNNQKRHLQYTKGGAVYAQWSEMMVYTLIIYNQFLCFSAAFTSVGICGAHCVRSEPWYWSLNLPGSSWIFLPKATQTTTQPLDTSAPVAQHFWWAQVDSSAAGPWDQMNFDHGDDRFLVLNLHQMPALFHNCITRTGWLPPCWETQSWSSGNWALFVSTLNIRVRCFAHARWMPFDSCSTCLTLGDWGDTVWASFHGPQDTQLKGNQLGQLSSKNRMMCTTDLCRRNPPTSQCHEVIRKLVQNWWGGCLVAQVEPGHSLSVWSYKTESMTLYSYGSSAAIADLWLV